jgi:hypothetical protein
MRNHVFKLQRTGKHDSMPLMLAILVTKIWFLTCVWAACVSCPDPTHLVDIAAGRARRCGHLSS